MGGIDYYEVVGLPRSADDIEVKKAYRRLALKYHPDCDDTETAAVEFARVSEAYEVLRHPKTKGFYDLYGEEALKNGMPDGKGGTKGGFFTFDEETQPQEVFAKFFGTNNPYEALNDISAQFEAVTSTEKPKIGKQKTYDVHLTLEEIFHGCLKKVTHQRKTLTDADVVEIEERELIIDVKPGLPDGTRFVFEGEGNSAPGTKPGNVIFVLKSLPHDRFKRGKGADLIYAPKLPLFRALSGSQLEVETLDKRVLHIPLTDIVTPGYKTTIHGEGMPKLGGGVGDLSIEPQLLFPTGLSETQQMLLRAAFYLPNKLKPEQAKALRTFDKAFKHELHGWNKGFTDAEGL